MHPAIATFAPNLFKGKVALVTGGGRGIGRSIALAFAQLGADVIVASRTEKNLQSTAGEIESIGSNVLTQVLDVRDTNNVNQVVQRSIEEFGGIDFLINNAGGQFPAKPFDISDNGWRSVVDLNLNGTWNMTQRVGKRMIEQGRGCIVNIVHIYSYNRGAPSFVHSGAARSGVVSMTKSLAPHLGKHGVTINALAPGTIATQGLFEEEYAHSTTCDFYKKMLEDIPIGRLGDPDEVAGQCAFLCSPAGRYINGADLVADGGLFCSSWTNIVE